MLLVHVRPLEARVGVVNLTVLVQALAVTNGADNPDLLPVSTVLTLRGVGPRRLEVGPMQPQSLFPDLSHFDVEMLISEAGYWTFFLDISGPIGDTRVEVPLEIAPSETDGIAMVVLAGVAIVAIGGLGFVSWRRLRRRSA